MKQSLILLLLFVTIITTPSLVFAQAGTQSGASTDDHTAREEAEGKEIWEKLQSKRLKCANLTDDNFEALGEYLMGQMAGESHKSMNNMMERMLGEEGEQQMHVVMGKRLSGCQSGAQLPKNVVDFMPMMNMMMGMTGGGGNPMMGNYGWNNMMGTGAGFGILSWIPMIFFWAILILGVVALIRYFGGSGKRNDEYSSPLDILKKRYAKGEISKKEFEEMKKEVR